MVVACPVDINNHGQVFLYDEDLPADAVEAALAAEQRNHRRHTEIVADPRN